MELKILIINFIIIIIITYFIYDYISSTYTPSTNNATPKEDEYEPFKNNILVMSNDLKTLNSYSPNEDSYWVGITFVNNKFIAVGDSLNKSGYNIISSTDGITWTFHKKDIRLNAVTFGNNVIVAVGQSNDEYNVKRSIDNGDAWELIESDKDCTWNAITFGNNKFVAVGNNIMTSADGSTWNIKKFGSFIDLYGVLFTNINNNPIYIAVGSHILKSTNGDDWTIVSYDNTNWLYGIAYGNNKYVIVGSKGAIITSIDTNTWTKQIIFPNTTWYNIIFDNNKFVAVGQTTTGRNIMTSTDGIDWDPVVYNTDNTYFSIAYGNNKFVAVGY